MLLSKKYIMIGFKNLFYFSGIIRSLLGLQLFTGVDSTKRICWEGKKEGIFIVLRQHTIPKLISKPWVPIYNNGFWILSQKIWNGLFASFMGNNINEARHSLFCTRALSEVNLPHCHKAHCSCTTYKTSQLSSSNLAKGASSLYSCSESP